MKSIIKTFLFTIIYAISGVIQAQDSTIVEGYVYENGNRGYLDVVQVTAINKSNNAQVAKVYSNSDGFFTFKTIAGQALKIEVLKDMFESKSMDLTPEAGKKNFLQYELKREPGYIFEITMAEKREDDETPVDAISGTRVEVYNNTKHQEVLLLLDYEHPEFRVNLQKGNHYTIMIRKEGYLAKRMEAFVNVKGCILCFEGIGSVRPGVSETMTEGNDNGLLLANVALERIYLGKKMEVENIYYDLAKWDITTQAETQLNKIIQLTRDNPRLTLELGSHTDSRGKDAYNMSLSQKRAKAAVDYINASGNVRDGSITSKGYGESQISNKCKNGVKCSENEHAVNRRTELMVTGMLTDSREKSLMQMKTEEKLELEILSGGSDEQQIEVRAGETIDQALARIEKEKASKVLSGGLDTKPDAIADAIKANAIDEAVENVVEQPVEHVAEEAVEQVVEEAVEHPVEHVEEEVKEEVVEEVLETSKSGFGGIKVDVPQLAEDADGIYISIHNGTDRLPMTHKIYKTFSDLNWYPSSDGNIYYIIDRVYPSEDEAQSYIDLHIKSDYPKAKVLRFAKGVRKK